MRVHFLKHFMTAKPLPTSKREWTKLLQNRMGHTVLHKHIAALWSLAYHKFQTWLGNIFHAAAVFVPLSIRVCLPFPCWCWLHLLCAKARKPVASSFASKLGDLPLPAGPDHFSRCTQGIKVHGARMAVARSETSKLSHAETNNCVCWCLPWHSAQLCDHVAASPLWQIDLSRRLCFRVIFNLLTTCMLR